MNTTMTPEQNEIFNENITRTRDQNLKNVTFNKSISLELSIAMFAHKKFHFYGYFTVNGCGIFTNVLVIATVLSSDKLRKTSSGLLITVLAHADLLTCVSGTVVMAMYYNKHINIRPYCLILEYFWNVMTFYSHWIMVLIGVNRYALVCHTFTHNKVTSFKSTISQLAVLLVLCAVIALYNVFGRDNGSNDCHLTPGTSNMWIYFISTIVIKFIFSNVVPASVTMVLTILVVRTFRKNEDTCLRRHETSTGAHKQLEEQVTKALVTSNLVYVLLSFPSYIVYMPYFLNSWYTMFSLPVTYNLITAVSILRVVGSINFAINFFIYSWYSPMFRKAIVCLFRCNMDSEKA